MPAYSSVDVWVGDQPAECGLVRRERIDSSVSPCIIRVVFAVALGILRSWYAAGRGMNV